MSMKVHNAELYVEAMQSADWSLSEAQRRAREEKNNQKGPSGGGGVGPVSASASSPHRSSLSAPASGSHTDALAGKRAVLEAEFRAKMDIAKRESDRRVHEKAVRQERQFEDRYANFMANNRKIVADSKMHEEVSAIRERKRERLYQEWMQKVFLPMQNEINSKIESADTEEIIAFRNKQYQSYLEECNRAQKNGGGIHRDVIVETQYNPFVANGAATVKYATVGLADDPLKNRITRESELPGGSNWNANNNNTSSSLMSTTTVRGPTASSGASFNAASLSARYGANHKSFAQTQAHASKFVLMPSEALGTTTTSTSNIGGGVFDTNNAPFAGSGSSSGRAPRFLPSVGSVSLGVTNPAGVGSSSNRPNQSRLGGTQQQPLGFVTEPKFKFSANNSLYNPAEPIPLRGTLVDVKQWARMDATPHGRYSDDNIGPTGRPRVTAPGSKGDFLKSDVKFDHYTMPRGAEGVKQAKSELGLNKGKRCGYVDKSKPIESPLH